MTKLIPIVAPLIISGWGASALAHNDGMMDGYNDGRMMDWWHAGGGGWIMWIVLLILIGVIVYLIAFGATQRGGQARSEDAAIDILKKRYARGEITKEEFDRMKKDLT